MKWAEICVHTAGEAEEAVANILHETGATGVVIEDAALLKNHRDMSLGEIAGFTAEELAQDGVVLKAYLPINSALTDTIEEVRDSVTALTAYQLDIGPGQVTVHEVDSSDWESEWKKYYKPVRISERLVVKPTWETFDTKEPEDIIIELDPGMAFGTGTHPSTVLSLRALEKVMDGGERVVDIGSGSGILSIAAAKLGAANVTALDLDDAAVQASRENVAINKVQSQVDVQKNDLLTGITQTFDIAIANILAEVIVRFASDVAARLASGGIYITSGIIKTKVWDVQKALVDNHFVIMETFHQDDWVAIIAQKR